MGLVRAVVNLMPSRLRDRISKGMNSSLIEEKESDKFINISFSQEGEDLVLFRLIGQKSNGFYVDVGAHHPFRFSNTYKFYLMGWNGINIDPLPGSMTIFKEKRPKDINLEIPILGDSSNEMTYFMFDEPALNTFEESTAIDRETNTSYKLIDKRKIKPYRLEEVLDQYLQPGQAIDFLSVDVEGMDMEVLESNNWNKYRPDYIIAESLSHNIAEISSGEIARYLVSKNYSFVAKTANSIIFLKNG